MLFAPRSSSSSEWWSTTERSPRWRRDRVRSRMSDRCQDGGAQLGRNPPRVRIVVKVDTDTLCCRIDRPSPADLVLLGARRPRETLPTGSGYGKIRRAAPNHVRWQITDSAPAVRGASAWRSGPHATRAWQSTAPWRARARPPAHPGFGPTRRFGSTTPRSRRIPPMPHRRRFLLRHGPSAQTSSSAWPGRERFDDRVCADIREAPSLSCPEGSIPGRNGAVACCPAACGACGGSGCDSGPAAERAAAALSSPSHKRRVRTRRRRV